MWLTLRVTGAALGLASAIWLAAGYAYGIALDHRLVRAFAGLWHAWLLKGPFLGAFGSLVGPALYVVGRDLATERRWRRGARRGTAILRSLHSPTSSERGASQVLMCTLEAQVAGLPAIQGGYRASVAPIDVRVLVEGIELACEANPLLLPGRVRIWLLADPLDRELTGRYLDFHPV